mgnify:CR=1 FL=1
MVQRRTFTASRSTPVGRRVAEVGGQVREWIRSLDAPDRFNAHSLRSKGFERQRGMYLYHYELLEDKGSPQEGRSRGRAHGAA